MFTTEDWYLLTDTKGDIKGVISNKDAALKVAQEQGLGMARIGGGQMKLQAHAPSYNNLELRGGLYSRAVPVTLELDMQFQFTNEELKTAQAHAQANLDRAREDKEKAAQEQAAKERKNALMHSYLLLGLDPLKEHNKGDVVEAYRTALKVKLGLPRLECPADYWAVAAVKFECEDIKDRLDRVPYRFKEQVKVFLSLEHAYKTAIKEGKRHWTEDLKVKISVDTAKPLPSMVTLEAFRNGK